MEKEKLKKMLIKLRELQKNAYVPYSNFRVAAIVVLKNQEEILGVNIENASFPASICAERAALSQVVTLGYKKDDIEALFLITDSKTLGSPCGICRQFMVEIMPSNANVYITNLISSSEKDITSISVKDLLPIAFVSESLKGSKK